MLAVKCQNYRITGFALEIFAMKDEIFHSNTSTIFAKCKQFNVKAIIYVNIV